MYITYSLNIFITYFCFQPLVKFKSHLYFEEKDYVQETEKALKPLKGSLVRSPKLFLTEKNSINLLKLLSRPSVLNGFQCLKITKYLSLSWWWCPLLLVLNNKFVDETLAVTVSAFIFIRRLTCTRMVRIKAWRGRTCMKERTIQLCRSTKTPR